MNRKQLWISAAIAVVLALGTLFIVREVTEPSECEKALEAVKDAIANDDGTIEYTIEVVVPLQRAHDAKGCQPPILGG